MALSIAKAFLLTSVSFSLSSQMCASCKKTLGPAEIMYSNGSLIKSRIGALLSGMEDVKGTLTDSTVRMTVKPVVHNIVLNIDLQITDNTNSKLTSHFFFVFIQNCGTVGYEQCVYAHFTQITKTQNHK